MRRHIPILAGALVALASGIETKPRRKRKAAPEPRFNTLADDAATRRAWRRHFRPLRPTSCPSRPRANYDGLQSRQISKATAEELVRPVLHPVLHAGHEVTVRSGVVLRRAERGGKRAYLLIERAAV